MIFFPTKDGGGGKKEVEQMESLFPYEKRNISTPYKSILIGLPPGKPAHMHKG